LQCFPLTGSIGHKRRTIEIRKKFSDEAQQGPIHDEYKHGQAQGEDGPGSAILGQDGKGKGGRNRRRTAIEDDQVKKSKGWPLEKECGGGGGKPQCHPKATFDILMAKYKEGRAGIRGRENWTI
jgi:hypothetical protein